MGPKTIGTHTYCASRILARTCISCRGILNGPPANAAEKQRQQHTRFVPQVPKLVEDAEEETPRTRLKRVCAQETSLHFAAARTRCNSTSVAEAAAAAAAAAAATAAASTAAAVAESAKTVDDRAEGGGAEDASVALPHSTVSLFQALCSCARGGWVP